MKKEVIKYILFFVIIFVLSCFVNAQPGVWLSPDSRIVYRDPAGGGSELIERINNYAFMGEQIYWEVLVYDENGIDTVSDVRVVLSEIGQEPGGGSVEVGCDASGSNAWIGHTVWLEGRSFTSFDSNTMRWYSCSLSVENYNPDTDEGMHGEFWIMVEVEDLNGNLNTYDENERWFLNPIITVTISDELSFEGEEVIPGTRVYSDTILVSNNAEDGSGVMLDMRISGTNFYDSTSSSAACPTSNRIRLNSGGSGLNIINNASEVVVSGDQVECDSDGDLSDESSMDYFCYYASNGGYSSWNDVNRRDSEGYVGIPYETGNKADRVPIVTSSNVFNRVRLGNRYYFASNLLSPGSDIAITFRLIVPKPCSGNYDSGTLYFWGEAV